jgi:hypothetical protein
MIFHDRRKETALVSTVLRQFPLYPCKRRYNLSKWLVTARWRNLREKALDLGMGL